MKLLKNHFVSIKKSAVQDEMIKKKTVVRSKFSQLNDKRFYFTDDFKKEKGQKIK